MNGVRVLIACILYSGAALADPAMSWDRWDKFDSRPWPLRYLILGDSIVGMKGAIKAGREFNAERPSGRRQRHFLFAEGLFEASFEIALPPSRDDLSVIVIEFDTEGHVLKPHNLTTYVAKRNMADSFVLVPAGWNKGRFTYYLADWSQGVPGETSFSPGVCTSTDSNRYGATWLRGARLGDFGCREWTARLYDSELPYIDVTTYSRSGNYIGEFVGWSRFSDPPKPVIGMLGRTWVCLHECPDGETPGVIKDFKTWLARHHFPVPKRPRKQPEYPNKDYREAFEVE